MSTSDVLSIIGIALTVIFGVAGLIVGGTIIKKLSASSKIGNNSNGNTVNQNVSINEK